MTISRVIDGKPVEIELTKNEMFDVYRAVRLDDWIGRLKDKLYFWSDEFPMGLSDEELRELAGDVADSIEGVDEVYDAENDYIWDCIVDYLNEKGRLE